MNRKRIAALISLLALGALILSACGTPTRTRRTSPTRSEKPTVGGEATFVLTDDPDTVAPFWYSGAYAGEVIDRVYGAGLLRIGLNMKPEPALAETMPTVSPDQKTYTFKLRKGIKFHDGTDVTAHDIAFSYQILMDKDYAGRFKSIVDPLQSVKALADNTIEFKTKDIFAPFLFESASIHPLPRHLLKGVKVADMAQSDIWKKPIGAGPYKLEDWKSGQYVLLTRFDQYWETGKPGVKGGTVGPWIEKIRLKVIPEDNTAIAALEAGEITYMGSVIPTHVERLKQEQKEKLQSFDWNRMGYGYQTFNNEAFPTNIREVRQALSYGLNRPDIIVGVMDGRATIPPGFVPPIHWVFDKTIKGYQYNPQKAAELLARGGFKKNAQGKLEKDGKLLKIKYVATKGTPLIDGIALQSKKDWEALGAVVELVMVDFNTLLDKHLKPGDFTVTFSGMGFSVDPHSSFVDFHSSGIRLDAQGVNQGDNLARYRSTAVDQLIDKGKTTVDLNERLKIYQQAQRMIVDDAPANWIYVNKWTDFAKKEVKGIVNWDGYGMSFDKQWVIQPK